MIEFILIIVFFAMIGLASLNWSLIQAIITENERQARELWYIRESIPEANRLIGAICSSDVSVPISNIPDFIEMAEGKIKSLSMQLQINCFGHIGDGNIHFNVFPPKGKDKNDYLDIKQEYSQ